MEIKILAALALIGFVIFVARKLTAPKSKLSGDKPTRPKPATPKDD